MTEQIKPQDEASNAPAELDETQLDDAVGAGARASTTSNVLPGASTGFRGGVRVATGDVNGDG